MLKYYIILKSYSQKESFTKSLLAFLILVFKLVLKKDKMIAECLDVQIEQIITISCLDVQIVQIVTISQHIKNAAIVRTVCSGIFRHIWGHSAIFSHVQGY